MVAKETKALKKSPVTVPLYVLGPDNRLRNTGRRVPWVDVKKLPLADIAGKAPSKARAAVKRSPRKARAKG